MNKLFLSLSLLVSISISGFCQDNTLDCIPSAENEFIQRAQKTFETIMNLSMEKQSMDNMYLEFLGRYAEMQIPPQFFVNQESAGILEEIGSSEYFPKFWRVATETPDGLIIIEADTKSPWFTCIEEKTTNKGMLELYQAMKEVNGVSPGLKAEVMIESLKDKAISEEAKAFITLGFFYQHALFVGANMKE